MFALAVVTCAAAVLSCVCLAAFAQFAVTELGKLVAGQTRIYAELTVLKQRASALEDRASALEDWQRRTEAVPAGTTVACHPS